MSLRDNIISNNFKIFLAIFCTVVLFTLSVDGVHAQTQTPPMPGESDARTSPEQNVESLCKLGSESFGDLCWLFGNAPETEMMESDNNANEIDNAETKSEQNGGGCLIATAVYGTESAPQVQMLREIRTNTVMSTEYGSAFVDSFNNLYYSFSPTIADVQREFPPLRDATRILITPMITTLSIMTLADAGSESDVLGLGLSIIALNLGMYVAVPALVGFKVYGHIKHRKIHA